MHPRLRWAIVTLAGGWAALALAQYAHISTVHDGFGTRATGGGYTHWGSGAQPGGIRLSWAGSTANFAGYLQTFSLKPAQDTDRDGLADEVDLDNDGDGLADGTELEGSGFDPASVTDLNDADTDDDGMSDGEEAVAGTNPTNIHALLKIVAISNAAEGRAVAWLARGGNQRLYVVKARTNLVASAEEAVFSSRVAGGVAPWYEVTNTVTDATAAGRKFYYVEVAP